MKIVVATDSFKGSVSAREASEAVQRGIRRVLPSAEIVLKPMADGGEGTADILRESAGGDWVPMEVSGPLPGQRVEAGFLWLAQRGPGALVEMAKASGIELLEPDQLDPLMTTTYGTGELVAAALERGARRLWLAIGGSATVDGGIGAAGALGWRFLDRRGASVGSGGAALERIEHIQPPTSRLGADVQVLCDVDHPLLGPRGAARVFGPQKGASPETVERLEAGLANLADVIERDLGKDVREIPGAGAAGGLGAGAVAFLGARLVPGIDAVMDASALDEVLAGAAWVVTGEGRYDAQSRGGKVVSGVVAHARRAGCKVGVVAGSSGLSAVEGGVDAVEIVTPGDMPLAEALARGSELIEEGAARLARRCMVER